VLVTKTTVVWCNLTKIDQSQIETVHHNVVTVEIIVSVPQTVERVNRSHQLGKCVFLLLDIVQHSWGSILDTSGSGGLHHVVSRVANTSNFNACGQIPLGVLLELLARCACFNPQILHVAALCPPHCISARLLGNFDGHSCALGVSSEVHASSCPSSHHKLIVVPGPQSRVPVATRGILI
jgi:hypothetical protein